MTLYRKYRAQTLDELVGQTQVKQILKAAVSSGKLAHAYLLHGPRGTGKTSTARILAKIVNCEKADDRGGAEQLPCNKCASCQAITDGSSLDVIEMDAASNRGIDDIRALRENIKLAPAASRKKVYIIDEVHMLSGDAFNALLKTLEEPPEHVLFILATTELQKVPATILSRVQKLDFKPATNAEVVELLSAIAAKEKIDIEKDALIALAKKANGSFRDGVKLLDQLSALGKIAQNTVEENLGSGVWENQVALLSEVSVYHSKEALEKLMAMVGSGANVKELTASLMELGRELLFIKNGLGEQLVRSETDEGQYKQLEDLARSFEMDHLLAMIDAMQKSAEQARFVSIPSLPLELAVAEVSINGIEDGEKVEEGVGEKFEVRGANDEGPRQVAAANETSDVFEPEDSDRESARQETGLTEPKTSEQGTESAPVNIKKITDRWTYVLETVKQYNYSLEALLRNSKIIRCEEGLVVIEVPYSFHQRILEAPKSKDLLESILADVLGHPVKISAVLGKRPAGKDELANVEVAADDEIVKIAAEIFNSDPAEH